MEIIGLVLRYIPGACRYCSIKCWLVGERIQKVSLLAIGCAIMGDGSFVYWYTEYLEENGELMC